MENVRVDEIMEEFVDLVGRQVGSPLEASNAELCSGIDILLPGPPKPIIGDLTNKLVATTIVHKSLPIKLYLLIDSSILFFHTITMDIMVRYSTELLANGGLKIHVKKYTARVYLAKTRHRIEVSDINIVTKYLTIAYTKYFNVTNDISFSCDVLSIYTPQEIQAYWKALKKATNTGTTAHLEG
jgi:hypothetical protein